MTQQNLTYADKSNRNTVTNRPEQIVAEDMNEIKTTVNANALDAETRLAQNEADNNSAKKNIDSISRVNSVFDDTQTIGDPGAGLFRLNGTEDALFISYTQNQGSNIKAIIENLNVGSVLKIQAKDNKYRIFNVTGLITDNATWAVIPISVNDSGDTFVDGDLCGIDVFNVLVVADEEDITVVNKKYKQKDRDVSGNQKGYRIIRQNFDFSNIPAEYDNSIWEIRYEHNLGALSIDLSSLGQNIPNVTLKFNGGLLSNGSVVCNNTRIEADNVLIFNNINLTGLLNIQTPSPNWFNTDGINKAEGIYGQNENIIYVSPTVQDLTVSPPIYNTLAGAMASITDNSKFRRYSVQLLSGTFDAREILLKDYVDIIRSPLASGIVIIEHDFTVLESFKNRDLFKTSNTPYDATDTFPLHCNIEGIWMKGENLNYCIHSDFNDSPDFELTITNCILQNNDPATTAQTAEYALGVGIYGGQKITINNTRFFGRTVPVLEEPRFRQGSGWIIHNRATQTRPCEVNFNNCNSESGFYGGRVADYGSGQKDAININGGGLYGNYGNLLLIQNVGVTTQSLTVNCTANITRLQTSQEYDTVGSRINSKVLLISPITEVYKAFENIVIGDVVFLGSAFGTTVRKTIFGNVNPYITGVAINDANTGELVTVQVRGNVPAKLDAVLAGNVDLAISTTVDGSFKTAGVSDKIFATTLISSGSGLNTELNPGLTWVELQS